MQSSFTMSIFLRSFKFPFISIIVCFSLILIVFALFNIDNVSFLSNKKTLSKPVEKVDHKGIKKTADGDTYWTSYYERLIKRTKIVTSYPPKLQLKEPCKGKFYPDMKHNMNVVMNYPVIKEARMKYKDIFDTFEQPLITNRSQTHPTMVSGASSNHYYESLAMIKSFKEKILPNYPGMKLIIFDLGLRNSESNQLKGYCNCEIRKFPFHEYPAFVSKLNNYVWKPLIMYTMLKEFDFVMWVDSSINFNGTKNVTDLFFSKAKEAGILARTLDFCSFCRSYYVTKKDTFTSLNESACLFGFYQLESGFVPILKTSFTWKYIIQPWIACALIENCISHRNPEAILQFQKHSNTTFHWCHRFDQSALSIILQRLFNENINIVSLNRIPVIYEVKRGQSYHIS